MRQRIRNILILMCVCIVGIYLFQGYWLYNSYHIQLDQFNKDINESLRTAVFNKQFADARRYFRNYGKDRDRDSFRLSPHDIPSPPGEPDMRTIHLQRESVTDTVKRRRDAHNGNDPSRREYADTLARQISDLILLNNLTSDSLKLVKLDSLFTAELHSRQILTDYSLDTFHIDFNGFSREGFRDSLRKRPPLQTSKIPFNPASNLFVQAKFESPLQYILAKMMWTLVGSLALLVLTTICFVYMLRTILKQKRLSEVKNDFINNMTHELKTPIATVYAAVEAMQNFNALNDQRKTQTYLDISKQELQRLSDLVEKVLHIAAEEREEIELFREPTDLSEMMDSIITNHQLKSGRPVQFRFDNLVGERPVKVDRTHLTNAVSNLVDNAIKYSGDQPSVYIKTVLEGSRLIIRVKDNGIGIPKIYQQNIFDTFFRVPTGNLHNVKGFGLGLSYVKKIVELHGGTISVNSEPEKGSEFIIQILV
ncbi:His Kinase A (phospho-acceptor) domain-containing protein [Chitinophaga sp. YR627]|uniref:sensor histidine kinase n=1 Tax=Chitinophaga sp. YR627 TaxID=1881041 RepID=UPI0008EEBDC8|nr:HAMP domain-containing sensor histidine kinase [Chitinophaga sp. YR627]SFN78375.1 His Kinase A (phospho-acceptor) domain-containing protein [Chitinophaga sp. YR627]